MKRKLSEFLPKAFHPVWRATIAEQVLNVVCKGGRGSGKSSDIAHIIVSVVHALRERMQLVSEQGAFQLK